MKCPHCCQEHPDDYKFCPISGQPLVPQTKVCENPKCKYENVPIEAKFCPRCGTSFSIEKENTLNNQLDVNPSQIVIICSEDGVTIEIGYGKYKNNGFIRENEIELKEGENVLSIKEFPELQYGFSIEYYTEKIEKIFLNDYDTSDVTEMRCMFKGCGSLKSLDLSSFKTSNVDDMSEMFEDCDSLSSLDLSSFDTSNVADMSYMFCGCDSLKSLDLSNFDTSNVADMSHMFCRCSSLKSLDLSSFDTSNVDDMDSMFDGCDSLKKVIMKNCDEETIDKISEALEDADIDAKIITD